MHREIKNKQNMYFNKYKKSDGSTRFYITDEEDKEYKLKKEGYITEVSIAPFDNHPLQTMVEYALGHNIDKLLYLHSFGTRADKQKNGYGRKMLQYLKDNYRGCVLLLTVCPPYWGQLSTMQLIKFYESEGFVLLDRDSTKNYALYPVMLIEL